MKKVLLLAFFSLAACAAAFSQIRVGGQLGYGTEIERWGLGANAEFMLNEKMAIAPSLHFFFPEKNGGVTASLWELNANFNYYFLNQDLVGFYGLAGLNFATAKVKVDGFGSDSNTELGLNLGIGVNFNLQPVMPFAEVRGVFGDYDQAVLFLGVKVPLAK